jgi:hypothetical protein
MPHHDRDRYACYAFRGTRHRHRDGSRIRQRQSCEIIIKFHSMLIAVGAYSLLDADLGAGMSQRTSLP